MIDHDADNENVAILSAICVTSGLNRFDDSRKAIFSAYVIMKKWEKSFRTPTVL